MIERNSVQIVPGAFSLAEDDRSGGSSGAVLVGDPVYNAADTRLRHSVPPLEGQLHRLPGSGREVEACARVAGGGGPTVLEGTKATRDAFLQAAEKHPSVIHLATHVLTPEDGGGQSFIAFSMGSDGRPELLATSDVSTLHVPDSVVVMTGCSSGTGEAVDGAGLLGLTRAWMAAGATHVIATGWPVRDRNGDLLPQLYRQWRGMGSTVAEALRRSQMKMLSAENWQADPSYWAAYQVTGGAR